MWLELGWINSIRLDLVDADVTHAVVVGNIDATDHALHHLTAHILIHLLVCCLRVKALCNYLGCAVFTSLLLDHLCKLVPHLQRILVVQDCVGELISELVVVQILLDALVEHWRLQQGVDSGPLTGAFLQAHLYDVLETVRVLTLNGRVPALCCILERLLDALDGPR